MLLNREQKAKGSGCPTEVQQGLHVLAEMDSSTHEDEGPAEPMDGSQDG